MLPWKEAVARLAAEAVRGGHASHVTSGGGGDGIDGGLLVHGGGALPSVTPSTVAAVCGWMVEQMDMKTAFLYGVVDEEIHMKQPEGYDDGSGRVCRLNKAIYGLKQAPRCWYARLVEALEALGFKVSACDKSLFMTEEEEEKAFLLVYVDDILLFSPSLERIKKVQGKLKETFQCKALGPVGYYLGLHAEWDVLEW
ncbi:unnamed protein product [Closterium sp. NIES-54]